MLVDAPRHVRREERKRGDDDADEHRARERIAARGTLHEERRTVGDDRERKTGRRRGYVGHVVTVRRDRTRAASAPAPTVTPMPTTTERTIAVATAIHEPRTSAA